MNVQLSIVRVGIREYRKKHRWKESNPRDAGLESGPQPLRTDVVKCGKRKEPPGAGDPAQTAPGMISRWRSHRWAARTRAQFGPAELVIEGIDVH